MRTLKTFLAALLVSGATSYGGLYYYNSSPGATIPDGNPGGYQNSINVSGIASSISSVLVYLNISGGYNGDLYGYLNLGGTSVVLVNRIGQSLPGNPFGSASAGFGNGAHTYENGPASGNWYSFKLDDNGSSGLHNAGTDGSPITGSYQPDALPVTSLASFSGANPNGNWTIFFADMAGGGGSSSSTLAGWGLEITAAPEPVNVALGVFGGVFLLGIVVRSQRVRARIQRCRAAFVVWVNAV
jgi:subtilisin-like proprotein convertase family protein